MTGAAPTLSTLAPVIGAGVLCGLCFGLQGPLANLVRAQLGPLESVFLLHFVGALVALVPMLLIAPGGATRLHTLPWYTYTMGAMGVLAILSIVYMIPRIGIAPTMALVTGIQLMTAALLDHYGALGVDVRPLTPDRIGGFLLVLSGFYLLVRR